MCMTSKMILFVAPSLNLFKDTGAIEVLQLLSDSGEITMHKKYKSPFFNSAMDHGSIHRRDKSF